MELIADTPSFLFLWVGSENLDTGRELFKRWGFKRCEDIVWIRTNKENKNVIKLMYIKIIVKMPKLQ